MARQLERFDNLVSLFLTRAQEKGDEPFLWAKREGAWRPISWTEAARQVAALATSLKRIGLQHGDRVCLVSENRPEWLIADLGIMAAGCITVPTYTTNTMRDHAHILGNSGARAVIVSTQKLARNLVPAVLTSSDCHHIIGIEDIRAGQLPDWVSEHRWSELTGDGDVSALRDAMAKVGR
ncbi:MAG TPA: AMP-binding protein, partial [Sphingomicrobium sp.]